MPTVLGEVYKTAKMPDFMINYMPCSKQKKRKDKIRVNEKITLDVITW